MFIPLITKVGCLSKVGCKGCTTQQKRLDGNINQMMQKVMFFFHCCVQNHWKNTALMFQHLINISKTK